MSLHKKTAIGVIWNLLEQFGKRGISGIVTVVLARFLVPEEFGLIAMLTVFIQIANTLMDSGFRQALIQKKAADHTDFCTVFYTNIALGVLAYLILFSFAPLIARFYEEPRLILLIRVVGISIIINSFRIIQEAGLSKDLNFKVMVIASVPGSLISGVIAVGMAILGAGVWALVAHMLLAAFFTTLFLWFSYGWRPSLIFSVDSYKSLFGFGSKLFLSGLLNIIFQNIFVVVIAKMFSAQEAGYYFFAHKMQQIVVYQLNEAVLKVTFPALASIQDQQNKLKVGFRQLTQVLTFVVFPVVLFIAALAEPIFIVFLSDSWLPAVPYMQLLFISGLLVPLHSVNLNILKVKGRSDLFLYLEVIKKALVVIILLISTSYGIFAILFGKIVTSILGYIPNSFFAKKLVGYSLKEQIVDISGSFIISFVIGFTFYRLVQLQVQLNLFLLLGLFMISSVAIYSLLSYVFNRNSILLIYKYVLPNKRSSK